MHAVSCLLNCSSEMAKHDDSGESDGPIIDDNIIRIQLRKPSQRKWELRTRNLSPGVRFPTIQLFDCEGNLLVETNDENVSIKSCEGNESTLRTQSLREKDFKHYIDKKPLRKNKTVSGGKIYTRVFRHPASHPANNAENGRKCYIIKDCSGVVNIPSHYTLNNQPYRHVNSLDITPSHSDIFSDISSYKSSDNETCEDANNAPHEEKQFIDTTTIKTSLPVNDDKWSNTSLDETDRCDTFLSDESKNRIDTRLHKSCSFNDTACSAASHRLANGVKNETLSRSKSGACMYGPPKNKVPFINTYLKSLPGHSTTSFNPHWYNVPLLNPDKSDNTQKPPESVKSHDSPSEMTWSCKRDENTSDNESINIPTDIAVICEMKNRLKMYRRGLSQIEPSNTNLISCVGDKRRHSLCELSQICTSSSSESVDEADLVLYRLKRRISRNRIREKRRSVGSKYRYDHKPYRESSVESESLRRDVDGGAHLRSRQDMGSNISQHSAKGLKGRRARSSGDLCNGDSKSQTESSVCGSVVGDVMGWNRSLPNHLDGNRHLADYSRVNNNYAEFGTAYNRCHPKGGRGLRYRVSKSGSDAEPVWKLQDPGFDQGYGSERSPEEDYVAPLPEPVSLDQYEDRLRAVYPFITEDNTFTVVVEKDGRGLGMSVCGSGGLVTIRRLYPPQPAWRTGRLAQRDLLLAANGVPLAGLSTYEALEVLRTAASRVELRVCRPPLDALESLTPPEPPTPPARTPHPPHLPPPDPLNCHPMHARLSATTSSATTSSSEGRGRREYSHSPEPNRHDLRLPNLDRPLPVYDVLYGEFDIIMTKVNGSLGFTLRKEDHSALGHYVRALVREPALSDGRIQPGDRIVAVNDTPMSNMSHAEAVAFLRACDSEVRLRLYRDHAATPLSPTSPKEEPTDSDVPMCRPKPPLRPEAVSMLCDLAARRLTPDAADGSRSPCLSPRKFRRLTKENHYEMPNVPPRGYELNNLDNDQLDAPNYQEDITRQRYPEPAAFPIDSDEPVSMPVELSSDEARFKHNNPAYQSAVLHTSSNSDATSEGHKDENGLKKWKGVALSPDNERKAKIESPKPPPQPKPKEANTDQKENIKPDTTKPSTNSEPTIVTVELNRGWNSRLGFSVQSHPESGQSYISAVYSDSVAARDGRLRRGDVILQVNDENVTSMKTPEVIDLLRILRGSICITVLRPPNPQ